MKTPTYLLSLIILSACNASVDKNAESEKLMQISRDWSNVAGTDSIEKTLSYWADDAIVLSPGQPSIKGKEAIRGMVEGMSKIPGFKISWEPISAEISNSGDMAYLIEKNQITVNDSLGQPHTTTNKGLTIWRKGADGNWKNIVDTWNADPSGQK